jgi:hypothetical protein
LTHLPLRDMGSLSPILEYGAGSDKVWHTRLSEKVMQILPCSLLETWVAIWGAQLPQGHHTGKKSGHTERAM